MSKNYQVNYTVKVDDLTDVGTRNAIRNLKRLAEAQKLIDKDRVLNKQAAYQTIALAKAAKAQQESKKKQSLSELSGYRQLLAKKNALYKTDQLKRIRGDEQALRSYLSRQQNLSSRLKGSSFTDHAGKTTNINRQLEVTRRIHQAETMLGSAIAANTRKRERGLAVQRRQLEAARRQRDNQVMATGAIAAGGLYMAKGSLPNVIGSATMQESMGLSLRALEGDIVGNQMKQNIEKYATTSGFRSEEVSGLYKAFIVAGKTGRMKFSEDPTQKVSQMDELSRAIGNPILAFANTPEDKGELVRQLSQVIGKGKADIRQDLSVMSGRGLAILQSEIEKITGESIFESGPVSSEVVLKAWINISKLAEVSKLMKERSYSLTQALDTVNEVTHLTAGSFGLLFARASGLPSKLNKVSDYLMELKKAMDGTNKGSDMTGEQSLTLGQRLTVSGVMVGGFTLGVLALAAAWKLLARSMGGSMGLLKNLGIAGGVASAITLAISDWGSMFDAVNKNGLSGLLSHFDKLVMMLAVLGAGWALGGLPGMAVAAIGLAAMTTYKKHQYIKKKEAEEAAAFSRAYKEGQTMTPEMTPWQSSPTFGRDVTMQKLFPKSEAPLMTPATPAVNIGISNIIEASTGKTKTTVNKSPNHIYNAWEKEYSF